MTSWIAHPRPHRPAARALVAGAVVLAVLSTVAACGQDTKVAGSSARSTTQVAGSITVFAAASLTESLTTLGKRFEAEHPGTKVAFSFGPSSGLAEQINQGAPADVFASASTTNMDQVTDAGNAVHPAPFAANVMEIAVPADNPAKIGRLSDLAGSRVKVALCQPEVPCGAVAATVFANAHLAVKPVSLEVDVKSVLSKVILGEVDAWLVYVTDVRAAGDKVAGIEIPSDVNASTAYPIATLKESSNPATARAFVAYVLSTAGSDVLAQAGFAKP
jgi:molybdate transport system substrate-binding protein